MFHAYGTCYEVWEQAKLLLYSNDTQRLYSVCHDLFDIVASRTQDPMVDYLGKMNALFHEFNEVLPPASTLAKEIEQRSNFFTVLTLHGLADKYSHVRDQILNSPVTPNFTSTCSILLRVSCKPFNDTPIFANDSSVLASEHYDHNHSRKPKKWRHKCDHCGKLGHKIDRCYALHGRSPRSVMVAQTDPVDPPSYAQADKSVIINEFLQWCEDRKPSSSTAYVTHTSTSFADLTQSSFIGPWVLDLGATYHITGNKSLFSSLSSSDNLPFVTMANGSRV